MHRCIVCETNVSTGKYLFCSIDLSPDAKNLKMTSLWVVGKIHLITGCQKDIEG